MARYSVAVNKLPSATTHIRVTGTSGRDVAVDYMSSGPNATSATNRRAQLIRVTTDGTGTAVTPEKWSTRTGAFHGTAASTMTAAATTTGSALIYLDVSSSTKRHGRWTPPRPNANVYLTDVERIAYDQTGATGSTGQTVDTLGFSDVRYLDATSDRIDRRSRHRFGFYQRQIWNEYAGGVSTDPFRRFERGQRWCEQRYWTVRSKDKRDGTIWSPSPDIQTTSAVTNCSSGSTQTHTSPTFNVSAGDKVIAVARAGRDNHTTAFSWTFSDNSTIGTWSTPQTSSVNPNSGSSFARQIAVSHVTAASSASNVTVTVDAWGTTDIGVYGIAVVVIPAGTFNTGTLFAQGPNFAYLDGGNSVTPALAGASTNPTYAVSFSETNAGSVSWDTPESGWTTVAQNTQGYYGVRITLDSTGDASGSTLLSYTAGVGDAVTADGAIFELAAAGGVPSTSINAPFAATMRTTGSKVATSGSTRAALGVTSVNTGSKIATTGTTRFAFTAFTRNTTSKIASTGALRALFTGTQQTTGIKVAGGSTRFAETVFGRFTGATVTNTVNGSVLMALAVTARASGSKVLTTGSTRFVGNVVERITAGKIYTTGATAFAVPVVERITTAKVATQPVAFQTPVTARNTGVKITSGGSTRFAASATNRNTGTKLITTGSSRFLNNAVALTSANKIATSGSTRILEPVIFSAIGGQSTAIQGLTRWLFAATIRATGTKTTTGGSTRFAETVTARASGSKSVFTAASTFSVPTIMRTTVAKIASNNVNFQATVTSRSTGTKLLTGGSTRFLGNAVMRNTGTKLTTGGSVRIANTITERISPSKLAANGVKFHYTTWFSAFRHIGTSPIARYRAVSLSGPRHMTFVRRTAIYTHIYNERHVTFNASNGQIVEK